MRNQTQARLDGWEAAVELVEKYDRKPVKANDLLGKMPDNSSFTNKRICQFFFYGVIRNLKLIDTIIDSLASKNPRSRLRALLSVAIFEIMDAPGNMPKVVDHAVGKAKKLFSEGEAKFVNAILRKVPDVLKKYTVDTEDTIEGLSIKYSYPEWLVRRWVAQFGFEGTIKLLIWNQQSPYIYVRLKNEGGELMPELIETKWKGFYLWEGSDWQEIKKLIDTGSAYIQDPATRIPVELANVQSGAKVLDLCAAPGGKSVVMAEKLGTCGMIVSVDLSAERLDRLKENLEKVKGVNYQILGVDLLHLNTELLLKHKVPIEYEVVLLDAPCSNTGVLRRRPDAKWRLREDDILKMAAIQLQFLKIASNFVNIGGCLIYSTCSIEEEENEGVVENFLEDCGDRFHLIKQVVSYPWEVGHDGGGAFLFLRNN